jgi:acyl carrier protein
LDEGPDMSVFERVQTIIVKELAVDESKVTEQAMLVNDLDADSLNKFSIIAAIEEAFGVELDPEKSMEAETVGDLIKLIER